MMPTVFLPDLDRVAVNDALQSNREMDALLVADALEMIDVLDALSAESLNTGHIDPEILLLLVDADLATSSVWLCTALEAAMDGRGGHRARN